jgi:hypothetical protein
MLPIAQAGTGRTGTDRHRPQPQLLQLLRPEACLSAPWGGYEGVAAREARRQGVIVHGSRASRADLSGIICNLGTDNTDRGR